MSLVSNLITNYHYLLQDFNGVSFNYLSILSFGLYILIPIILVIVFYLLGSKISSLLPKVEDKNARIFIDITLGFIASCTGILILGMLNLLYLNVLYSYYTVIIIVSIFPISNLKQKLNDFFNIFKDYKSQFLKNKLVNIAIISFILISFLRLISPEVGVDAIWYHTDYPKIYINDHSMMTINPKGKFYPAVTPTLSDMMYVFSQSVLNKDLSKYIHFTFYLLVILTYLIVFRKRFRFIPFAALLFVTSPVIIRIAPSAYAEFPWIICWLLAVFLITSKNKLELKDIVIPAVLVGGTLATKLWMLPFYGVFVLYIIFLNLNKNKINLLKYLMGFTIITFSIPFLWYLRAFIITGNPLFPTFWNYPDGSPNNPFALSHILSTFNLEGLKIRILSGLNVSPFSIIGLLLILPLIKIVKHPPIKISPFYLFTVILTIVQIVINYSSHRFVIPFYSIFAIVLAIGVEKFIELNKLFKYLFYFLLSIFFLYYFINALLVLPYGLGWADINRYLTRILSRDNLSYYNFNNQFSKYIIPNEKIATYGIWGFYYANFNFIYTEEIFRKGYKSIEAIKENGANKLIILGGDINWLCTVEKLTDCSKNKYKLLTYYKFPTTASSQYLYLLK